ncbi:MAG: T9SS type A sorting domain-containing protein [Bacteroidia bacterium]|jgi:hypothetical protein|nr:T9SS type A sorting domain-containing protein [Bacteroidia bacterium]
MKNTLVLLIFVLWICPLHAQLWHNDIGSNTTSEETHDAVVLPEYIDAMSNVIEERSIIAGTTTHNGFPRLSIACVSNKFGNVLYHRLQNISFAGTAKENTVISSVRIAHNKTVPGSNCTIAGSFMRTSTNGSVIYGYGFFSATLNPLNGTLSNLKAWNVNVAGATDHTVASVAVNSANTVFITGSIRTGTSNAVVVFAVNGTNNTLIWSTRITDPSVAGRHNAADLIVSTMQPAGVPEIVVAGNFRPSAGPVSGFAFRMNATSGAAIGSIAYFPVSSLNSIRSLTISKNSSGVADGYFLCGDYDSGGGVNYGFVIKVNNTLSAVNWTRNYQYPVSGSLTVAEIEEAIGTVSSPWAWYIFATAQPNTAGSAEDFAVIKINPAGTVISAFTIQPSAFSSNQSEVAVCIETSNIYQPAMCVFGTRSAATAGALPNYCAMRVWDDGISCDSPLNPAIASNTLLLNLSLTTPVTSGSFTSVNHTTGSTSLTIPSPICYFSTLPGPGKLAGSDLISGIYPNPAHNQFTLQLTHADLSEQNVQLQILDMSGRVLLEQTITQQQTEISVSTLPAGTYIWQVNQANGNREKGKLIIVE